MGTHLEIPYLLMLLLFCLDPNRPCKIIMLGFASGSATRFGGSCNVYARLSCRGFWVHLEKRVERHGPLNGLCWILNSPAIQLPQELTYTGEGE